MRFMKHGRQNMLIEKIIVKKIIYIFSFCLLMVLKTFASPLLPNSKLHYTTGSDVDLYYLSDAQKQQQLENIIQKCAEQKLTAFESYVKWSNCELDKDQWTWQHYRLIDEICTKNGIKWVPFLIAGSAWATPEWFLKSELSVPAMNLVNGKQTLTQSIWNPDIRVYVKRFIEQFAKNFESDHFQSILLGVSGDFGESIFSAAGNKWTYMLHGEYYTEPAWWCGDYFAQADFRSKMLQKYGTLKRLNLAWGTNFKTEDEVDLSVVYKLNSQISKLDFVNWYLQSMTDYTEFWVKTAVEIFPNNQILICTGGDARPQLGADFSAQAKMAAQYNCGIRITNEVSDYTKNYTITKWLTTAARKYNIYFGIEPAGAVDNNGIVARVYNVVSSGADELFIYDRPPQGGRADIYTDNLKWLIKRQPIVKIAVFLPKESVALEELTMEGFYKQTALYRDYIDFDYLDSILIKDGFLKDYNVLIWPLGKTATSSVMNEIQIWLKEKCNTLFLTSVPVLSNNKPWNFPKTYSENIKFFEGKDNLISQLQSLSDIEICLSQNRFYTSFADGHDLVFDISDKYQIYQNKLKQ